MVHFLCRVCGRILTISERNDCPACKRLKESTPASLAVREPESASADVPESSLSKEERQHDESPAETPDDRPEASIGCFSVERTLYAFLGFMIGLLFIFLGSVMAMTWFGGRSPHSSLGNFLITAGIVLIVLSVGYGLIPIESHSQESVCHSCGERYRGEQCPMCGTPLPGK